MRRFLLTTVLLTAAFFSSAQSSQTVAPQTGTRPVFMKPRDWGGFNRYAAANAEVKTAPSHLFGRFYYGFLGGVSSGILLVTQLFGEGDRSSDRGADADSFST